MGKLWQVSIWIKSFTKKILYWKKIFLPSKSKKKQQDWWMSGYTIHKWKILRLRQSWQYRVCFFKNYQKSKSKDHLQALQYHMDQWTLWEILKLGYTIQKYFKSPNTPTSIIKISKIIVRKMSNGNVTNVMTLLTHHTQWDSPLNQTRLNYLRQSIRKVNS